MHRLARIAKRKIVGPAALLLVDPIDQLFDRHKVLPIADRLSKRFPVRMQRFAGRHHVQVSIPAAFPLPIVSEGISQKVHAAAGLTKIHDLRLFPIQLQTQPGLYLRLDKTGQSAAATKTISHGDACQ